MLDGLTEDALLHVLSFVGAPDLLRLSQTSRQLRNAVVSRDGAVITNVFKSRWGPHFAVWQPLFAVPSHSTRLKTAAVCDLLAAICGCWTLLNFEGSQATVRGGVCSVLPTANGLRVCLLAPKRVCLDRFEWEDSHPLEDIRRTVALLGRITLAEAMQSAYLVDRVLPVFSLDISLSEAPLPALPPKFERHRTVEADMVARHYNSSGDLILSFSNCVSCVQLLDVLRASVEPCLPHHDVFYPLQAQSMEAHGHARGAAPNVLHQDAGSSAHRMRDTSRYSLCRSDFHELTGQTAAEPPHTLPPPPASASHLRCAMCRQTLPSRGVQCCSSNCTCAKSNRPIGLKVNFLPGAICCLGFVCCTATLPLFDSADLLPLFSNTVPVYPITAPWSPSSSPEAAVSPGRPPLLPPSLCLCSAHGLWAGSYGPHGLEIVCILQVNPRFSRCSCSHSQIGS